MVGGLFTLLWGGDLDRKAGWNAAAIGFFGSCSRGKTNYAADSEIYSSGGVGAVGCVVSGALGEWGDRGGVGFVGCGPCEGSGYATRGGG